jgi:subtilisin family serine protease
LTLTAALAALASTSVWAQAAFVEKKGVQEFTGQMLVRPWTSTELQAQGLSAAAANQKAGAATLRIDDLVLETHLEVNQYVVRVPAGMNENSYATQLMATGAYKYVTPNWRLFTQAKPNDTQYSQQWHHQTIKSELGWDIHTGVGVIVAICDTGVDLTHPDLRANLVSGYNAVVEKRQVDGGQVNDLNGHGTHCAGDAAAIGNNGRGVSGVGWNLRVMPVRVSDSPGGGAALDDILGGARWGAENGAKVSSCSYAGVDNEPVEESGAYIRSKGGVLLYAAGNDNRNLNRLDFPTTIVVGASAPGDVKAGFSAYGRLVDLFAPGVGILSTTNGGGYGPASGTSMACPVAAGLFALVHSVNPRLTPAQKEQIVKSTCDRIGDPAIFGAGRINVGRAVAAARNSVLVESIVGPGSVTVSFGTLIRGVLANYTTVDRATAVLRSSRIQNVGEVAGITATYTLPNPTRIQGLAVAVHAANDVTQATGGSIFLWNYSTGRFDLMQTNPVGFIGGQVRLSVPTTSFSRYMSGGQVRVMYRALASDTRSGRAAPFNLTLDQVALLVQAESQ